MARRNGTRVSIEVSDDGPGVPEKARAHLFQAFQGSARKGGTGLGLAVAQELVTAHGGTIRLRDTQQGRGVRDRDPRPGALRASRGELPCRTSTTWPSSAAASTAAASPVTRRAVACPSSCARWAISASGTSSRSTKLIHGGLRYLEQYDFRLVREALTEREVLWRIAPHIVQPLRFVLPHQAGLRPAWMLRAGLFLYDHLGGRERLPGTRVLDLASDAAGVAR